MSARVIQLPALDYTMPVPPASARQDRVLVRLYDWSVSGTAAELEAFTRSVHNATIEREGTGRRPLTATTGQRLTRIPVRGGRDEHVKSIGAPLFGGYLTCPRLQPVEGQLFRRDFVGELALNPTQFALQQEWRGPTASVTDVEPSLFKRTDNFFEHIEAILVRSDNVLIGPSRFLWQFRPERWFAHVERYLQGVMSVITDTLRDAADNHEVELVREPTHIELDTVETYFEFYASDPVLEVVQLDRELRRLGRSHARQDYTINRIDSDYYDHSPRLSIPLQREASLKVYAKTTRRVRFEVVLKRRALATALGDLRGRRPIEDWSPMLARVAEASASRLNEIFQAVAIAVPDAARSIAPQDFLHEIYDAAPTPRVAQYVLRALTSRRALVNWPRSAMQPVIERLRRSRILADPRQEGRAHVYGLSREYWEAAEALGRVFGYLDEPH